MDFQKLSIIEPKIILVLSYGTILDNFYSQLFILFSNAFYSVLLEALAKAIQGCLLRDPKIRIEREFCGCFLFVFPNKTRDLSGQSRNRTYGVSYVPDLQSGAFANYAYLPIVGE